MSEDFVRIGTSKDPQVDANFVELSKVIRSLQNDIKTLTARVKVLEAK